MDVKACSPPDKRERDCIFFSGGLANISNPDCNGSSEPMSFNSALPPLNNLVKIFLKLSLTSSKLLRNLFLPSLFSSVIPSSNFLIARDKSSFSFCISKSLDLSSLISISALKFTAPKFSLSRTSLSTLASNE